MAQRNHSSGATGLAAKLERAAASGKLPVAEVPESSQEADIPAVRRRGRDPRKEMQELIQRRKAPQRAVEADSEELTPDEPEEVEWSGELPEPDPADVARAYAESLESRPVEDADLDRLWDWIRADEDKGLKFLGKVPATSSALRTQMAEFDENLYALIENIDTVGEHIGFAAVQPFPPSHALVHLYLAASVRGRARELVPQLMAMAEATYPGRTFVVKTPDPVLARLYKGIGFEASYVLEWTPVVVPVEEDSDGNGPG